MVLALLALGMARIRFRFAYLDGIVAVAQVLFIKIRLFPKKKRKLRLGNYKIKRFRKRINRNISRRERIEERKKRKKLKKENARKAKKADGEEPKPKKKRSLKPLIRLLLRILKAFLNKFPKYLQTEVSRLVIGVASDDAAKTAVNYGYTVQSVQYALELIKSRSNLKENKEAVISVYPDFLSEKSRIEIDVTFSIRIWQVVSLGISLLMAYLGIGKYKAKSKNSK